MLNNFEFNDHVFWKVLGTKFYNKFDALTSATQLNADISFHFYDNVFEQYNKALLGKQNLNDLYKQRAQQLRDEYDYLILYFSGGADSYNILRTFIDNNIKLDEVCVKWPMLTVNKNLYTPNTIDTSAFNYLSEWNYAIKPVLEWLTQTHPEIKIEIVDWSENFTSNIYNEENFRKANIWNDVEIGFTISSSKNEILLLDKGKRVACIYGIDKPIVASINGNWLCCFVDTAAGIGNAMDHNKNSIEYFYWTPKMPSIPLEQAHVLCSYIDHHPKIKHFFFKEDSVNLTAQEKNALLSIQSNITKSVIYTTWNGNFQSDKPMQADRADKQSWIFNHPEFALERDTFINVNSEFLSQIDQKFIMTESKGYQVAGKIRGIFNTCKTKWHYVKPVVVSQI
jgi:hypothetical protein